MRTALTAAAILGLLASPAPAQDKPATPKADEPAVSPALFLKTARTLLKWDEAAEPVRLVGPIYFVGTRGLGCYLIKGSAGHVVLHTGMPGSGPMIEASIRKLGFKPEDVKLILAGHAHLDHVGGHAHLKKVTGAKIAMMREEQELFESGGKLDFHYGEVKEFRFDPAKVDTVFRDEDVIELGDIAITARLTGGHTRGSTTYAMTVTDGGKTYAVVFPDGTSVNPGYRVAANPSYAGIGDDFRRTFRTLESLKPDIWLTAHNEVHGFDAKLARAAKEGVGAWVDPEGYRKWVAARRAAFEAAVAKEQSGTKSAATPPDSWVGQKVLARKAGGALTDIGKDGKPVSLPVRHIVYTAVAEDGDRIRVNYPGQEGWVAKADWVRLADALEHFTARVAADPKDAFARSRRGVANRYAGKPDLALKDLEEAVRLAPADADLVGIRGMMWWANKNLDRAIADYTEAVRLDPTYAVGFRNRGLARHAKGEFDKAVVDYTEAARVDPHYAPAFHGRAATWRARGEPGKALADLAEAVRLDPRYAAAMSDLARLLATCKDDAVRDGKRAVELATRANELTGGKDASALDALAAAHAEAGDFGRAVEFQRKALADPAFEKEHGPKARERLNVYEAKKPWRE